jgi:hypothetical protein
LIDHAPAVADDDVFPLQAQTEQQIQAGDAGRARAGGHHPDLADLLVDQRQSVEHGGGGDDRGAVLVVVKHRNLHPIAQLALDIEAFRGLDVFQVDAAETRLQTGDDLDQLVGIALADFDIEHIDAGEFLEQHPFAFHHRLGRQWADVAQAEHGGAVGDDRD